MLRAHRRRARCAATTTTALLALRLCGQRRGGAWDCCRPSFSAFACNLPLPVGSQRTHSHIHAGPAPERFPEELSAAEAAPSPSSSSSSGGAPAPVEPGPAPGLSSATVATSRAGDPSSPPIDFKMDWTPVATPSAAGANTSLATTAAAAGVEAAEDDDASPSAVQKFLFPDKEELPDDFELPIWDHLEELRERVLVAGLAALVAVLGCFCYSKELVLFLEAPVADAGVRFLQLSPGEFFFTTFKVRGWP